MLSQVWDSFLRDDEIGFDSDDLSAHLSDEVLFQLQDPAKNGTLTIEATAITQQITNKQKA